MVRMVVQATLTGAFCIVFALAVDAATEALSLLAIAALSFASGFLGSLFAQSALRRREGGLASSATAGAAGGRRARSGHRDELE